MSNNMEQGVPLRGGPKECPRPCSECDGEHHWIEVCPDPDDASDEDTKHVAATMFWLSAWYACKHCEAWTEDVDEGDDEC